MCGIYIVLHTYVYVCFYICMHVHTHLYLHLYAHTHVCTNIHTYMNMHIPFMMTLTAKIIRTVTSFRWTVTTSLSNSVRLLAYIVTSETIITESQHTLLVRLLGV